MMTDQYFAGLFDGEGCIGTSVDRRVRQGWQSYNVQPRASLGMAHSALPLLMEINAQYGGRLAEHKRNLPNSTIQRVSYISWDGKDKVIGILSVLLPNLKLKREQAELALWWAEMAIVDRTAKDMFIADMKAMKGNMLLTAAVSIKRIQDHLRPLYNNVVSIG
jgi:hypothetical protein